MASAHDPSVGVDHDPRPTVPGNTATSGGAHATREVSLDLVEETLEPRTRSVQTGAMIIRKRLVTETRTVEVKVRREEISVERRSLGGREYPSGERLDDDETAMTVRDLEPGQTIRIPLLEEEIVVQARPVVYEEVEVSKRLLHETRQVSGTVQREQVRVARRGEVDVSVANAENPDK